MNDNTPGPASFLADHRAAVATLRGTLGTAEIEPDAKEQAADFLEALDALLGGDGAVHTSLVYLLRSGTDAVRLRRASAGDAA